jgi:hypothetical protein
MTMRRGLWLVLEAIALVACLVASIGLTDALRHVPGPSLALALPLRETGHDDRASLLVVAGCAAVVFGLAALALGRAAVHPLRGALLRALAVLCGALVLQAVSLELVRQATLGLDWNGALGSPGPYATAVGALLGIAAARLPVSSDRRMRHGPNERPVEGRSSARPVVKIAP